MGVNVLVTTPEGWVALLPPTSPTETPAALPGGYVEYCELPQKAAVREDRGKTGLEVEIVRALRWKYLGNDDYSGPVVTFFTLGPERWVATSGGFPLPISARGFPGMPRKPDF